MCGNEQVVIFTPKMFNLKIWELNWTVSFFIKVSDEEKFLLFLNMVK